MDKRFCVALSFPGEKRDFVEQVAEALSRSLGKERVLYDQYLTAELARPDLDLYLGDLYRNHSDLVVPFFCSDYERKKWCKLEWRQMRDLLHNLEGDRIMYFRFDDAPISGLLSIDGYVEIGERNAGDVADLILKRLQGSLAQPPHSTKHERRPLRTALHKKEQSTAFARVGRVMKYGLLLLAVCVAGIALLVRQQHVIGVWLYRLAKPPTGELPHLKLALLRRNGEAIFVNFTNEFLFVATNVHTVEMTPKSGFFVVPVTKERAEVTLEFLMVRDSPLPAKNWMITMGIENAKVEYGGEWRHMLVKKEGKNRPNTNLVSFGFASEASLPLTGGKNPGAIRIVPNAPYRDALDFQTKVEVELFADGMDRIRMCFWMVFPVFDKEMDPFIGLQYFTNGSYFMRYPKTN